ncbi:UNVERIFIED_CONTAM: hypothetical protein FKN15_062075 [Acipenser sinensis]
MGELLSMAPDVASAFRDGHFTVRQTSAKFNAVWTDMVLEKTYNRDTKTQLFNGVSLLPAAVEKYLQALPILTAVSEQTKTIARLGHYDQNHHEDSACQAKKTAPTIRKIQSVVQGKMINPFSCGVMELLNISTGQKCESDDLVRAKDKGFPTLVSAQKKVSGKVEAVKLQTFATSAQKPCSAAQKVKSIYSEVCTVVRNLYFAQDLNEEKKLSVFSHEWTNYPPSLFEPDPNLQQGYAM